MKTLIIDNYDSFTFNLCQYVAELGGHPVVYKNDGLTAETAAALAPSHIIISPGPGTVLNKKDFGVCEEIILKLGPKIPLLGVCLGHQGIARAYGAAVVRAPEIIHGKQSRITHDGSVLFKNVPNPFKAMRYHSLCVSSKNVPKSLRITARVHGENAVMALRHGVWPIFGIQFHPESFGTPEGKRILRNFLNLTHAKKNTVQHGDL
jgi:anthranilate synthase component 2